jgi:hypothetical protein
MRAGRSRPKAGTDQGLPPIDSCKWWPAASDPQPTTIPAEHSGISAAGPERVGARPCLPIGLGLIARDQSSEPAGKTRGDEVVSAAARRRPAVQPRCGPARGARRRCERRRHRDRPRGLPRRGRAHFSVGGLILRHQSWAMLRRAPNPTARYRLVRRSGQARGLCGHAPRGASWRHRSRT